VREIRFGLLAACAMTAVVSFAAPAIAQVTPLSLRIPNESVPPGGVVQVKLELTEPMPISTGGGGFDVGPFQDFLGVAVNSPDNDAAAVAVVRGRNVAVRLTSPAAGLGTLADYPLLTMTVRAPATAPIGTRSPLTFGNAVFLGPGGVPYPYEIHQGEAVVQAGATISNVFPGSATLPPGSTVVIQGSGFEAGTDVRLKEGVVASVTVVSPTQINIVTGSTVTMHGNEVQVEIPSTRQRLSYYAYQRTSDVGASTHPLFAASEPAYPQKFWTEASVALPGSTSTIVPGIALQNIGAGPAGVTLELRNAAGSRVGLATATLPQNAGAVRSVSELFATPCTGGCTVVMRSTVPVQFLGLSGNTAQDAVTPLMPGAGAPPAQTLQLSTGVAASPLRAGDTLSVSAMVLAGDTPVVADAYIVIQLPNGQRMSVTPSGLAAGITPIARSVRIAGPLTQVVLTTPVPPGAPPGSYQILSAFASPGTLSLLTAVANTTFTIVP
jgi:hypothetical protein